MHQLVSWSRYHLCAYPSSGATYPLTSATAKPATFQLAIQGFIEAWSRAGESRPPGLPALQKLIRRGSVQEVRHSQQGPEAWRLQLLDLLGLQADRWHASPPVEWLGQGGEPQSGSWLGAEFVHLEVGSQSTLFQRIEALALDDAEALVDALRSELRFPGIEVLAPPRRQQTTQLFLHSDNPVEAVCFPADFAAATELRDVLPRGSDGPLLRRLLTEAQMVLHDHPVNARRERRGLRRVNAIWLTGLGESDGLRPLLLPRIASDDIYLKGLCRLHGMQIERVPDSAFDVLNTRDPGLVALLVAESDDASTALGMLERNWFAPLIGALEKGRLSAVELALDHHRVHLDRSGLRRFWRRGRLLSGLSQ